MRQYFPFMDWLFNYKKDNLQGDLTAGLTVAVMLIPQGMAYALLAGLPPITGLYASLAPLIIYALFGTSRQLAVGPVAMVSLLVAAGVGDLAQGNTELYLTYAILLAFLIGVIQFLMGVARMGFLVNFISHPVISGFTSAAALIIGFSQLKHLLGVNIPRSHHVHHILLTAIEHASEIHFTTVILGAISILLLLGLKKWNPAFPGALTAVVIGTLAVAYFELDKMGVKIVGSVPEGLPDFALPAFSGSSIETLLPIAVAISLVSFMESISVAKSMASKYNYKVDANQELIGLGLANIAGSFFKAYPVTGGFSRTAINAQAGAKTGLSSIITAVMIAITLIFLTPLLHNLPKAVLAAIIMVAVFGLVDFKEFFHLFKIKRVDALMLLVTFVATLSLGIEPGILMGVGLSLALFITRSAKPHFAILGRLPNSYAYRNLKYFPEAEEIKGITIVRIDASFYFGNVNFLQEKIEEIINQSKEKIQTILLDASSVNYLDSSAVEVLEEIHGDLNKRNINFYFASLKGPVRDVMIRSGFYNRVGADHCFFTVHDAVKFILQPKIEGKYVSEECLKETK